MKLLIKYLLLTFLFTGVSNAFSQQSELLAQYSSNSDKSTFNSDDEKEIDVPFVQGHKIYWYDSLKVLRQDLNLKDLEKSKEPQYIRIWTDKSAVDAWKDENGEYHCVVTSFCKSFNEKKNEEGEFYLKRNKVEDVSAQVLIDSLYAKNINSLKDYHLVKKMNKNLIDGVTYKVEISTPKTYRMFTFLNPENQNSNIEEVQLFLDYLKILHLEFDLNYIHRQFMMGMKNGTYVAGLEVISKKKGYTRFSNR